MGYKGVVGAVDGPVAVAGHGEVVQRLTLPASFESASRARLLLRDVAAAVGDVGWLDAGELACTEVITNAVLHAHTSMDVTARATADELLVEVRDRSPVLPVPRSYDGHATTGRGMALVAVLVSECGIRDAGPDGKTIWFRIGVDPDADDQDEASLLAAWADANADDAWDLATLTTSPPHPRTDEEPESSNPTTSTQVTVGERGAWVQLQALPPTLWLAARQHHDTILRELALYTAEQPVAGVDLVGTDLARSCISGAVWAAVEDARRERRARPALPDGHPTPLPSVPDPFDLDLFVPADVAPHFATLQDTLDVAERLAASAELLARPGLPEIVAVRDWACEQVIAQLAGAPAKPWPGTDDDQFTADVSADIDVSDGDLRAVREGSEPVIAADDGNRIVAVSRPFASLVGWDPEALVGRRIVTLIPPRLRDGHVAGFTRHLTTGTSHILGIPLNLPVLHADGSEMECRVLIEAVAVQRGHRYLAHITIATDETAT